MQAVGPRPERHERAGVTRGLPLAPPEPRQREAEQPDQYLGRATEMRELRHEAQGRAGAALPRSGDRIPLAFRREHAEFHGGPLRPEADHVAIQQHNVARDPLAIDEGPVFRAEVAQAERRTAPHEGGAERGNTEVTRSSDTNVR